MIITSNIDDLLNQVKEQYEYQKNRADRFLDDLKEYSRDKEIQKLKDQIRHLQNHSLQFLSDKELETLQKFRDEHYELHKTSNPRTAGSSMIYRLTGVGLGTVIEVTCPFCEKTIDITDTSNW